MSPPDARIINLETSVTPHDEYWPGESINYRMHPENVGCFSAAHIDVCGLPNNHVPDFVHGHSSDHPRPIEVYRHRLIVLRDSGTAASTPRDDEPTRAKRDGRQAAKRCAGGPVM